MEEFNAGSIEKILSASVLRLFVAATGDVKKGYNPPALNLTPKI
jgi:hypothetical protein